MNTLRQLYDDMLFFNAKAEDLSDKYNKRVTAITRMETRRANRVGIISQTILDSRIKSIKDTDQKLSDIARAQVFFKGEVERVSALLNGILAYRKLLGISSSMGMDEVIG